MISVLSQRFMKLSAMAAVRARKRLYGDNVPPPTIYYFAYGANLDPKRFEKYHMNVEPIGVAKLENFALCFSFPCEYLGKGYASADPQPGREVWGFLYKIDSLSLLLLDIMEWAILRQYRRITVSVKTKDGKKFSAKTYQARYPKQGLFPSTGYKNLIIDGARQHGFPAGYIEEIERVVAKEKFDLDPGFSLIHPRRRRFFEKALRKPYLWHDRIREMVCEKLRF